MFLPSELVSIHSTIVYKLSIPFPAPLFFELTTWFSRILNCYIFQLEQFSMLYSVMHKKTDKSTFKFFIYKKFKKQLYFFTCILPGYVFNECSKDIWKKSNFKTMRAGFLRRYQNSLRQNSPEIMHFQAWKKNISFNIMS